MCGGGAERDHRVCKTLFHYPPYIRSVAEDVRGRGGENEALVRLEDATWKNLWISIYFSILFNEYVVLHKKVCFSAVWDYFEENWKSILHGIGTTREWSRLEVEKKKQGLFLALLCFDIFIKWTKCFQKGCSVITFLKTFCIFVVLFDITVAVWSI